jgi:hypothetical protein
MLIEGGSLATDRLKEFGLRNEEVGSYLPSTRRSL